VTSIKSWVVDTAGFFLAASPRVLRKQSALRVVVVAVVVVVVVVVVVAAVNLENVFRRTPSIFLHSPLRF